MYCIKWKAAECLSRKECGYSSKVAIYRKKKVIKFDTQIVADKKNAVNENCY